GDVTFHEGDMVLSILSVGSRDPRKFEAPNAFDLDRKRGTHLTFSSGPHLCVGHVLGRAEIRILTEEWVKRIPSFRPVPGVPHRFRTGTVMALETLPIEWEVG
ncbi:MAG: cytochrome P450, partial [Sphingobium sp.]